MSKRNLYIILFCLLLIVYVAFDLKIYYSFGGQDLEDIPKASELLVEQERMPFLCDVTGELLPKLKKYYKNKNVRCYIQTLKANYFEWHLSVDKFLLTVLDGGSDFSSNDGVKLTTLWFLRPRVTAGDISLDMDGYYEYVRKSALDDTLDPLVLSSAIELLSYYQKRSDVEIFERHAMSNGGMVMEKSVAALLTLCTKESVKGIRRVLTARKDILMTEEYSWLREAITESPNCDV